MRNLGQILLLLFLIALPLLNFLLQRARKRRHHPIPQEKSVEQMFHQAQTTLPRPTPRVAGDRMHGSPVRTGTPPASNRLTKRPLLGTTRDVRRAIVIMTLLGPCRAFDPPD